MKNRYQTLQTIYELVKNDAHPTETVLFPSEIIIRQNFAWDEIVKYIDELKSENLINIQEHSPAVIFITEKGFQYIAATKPRHGNIMYAA